MSVLNLICLLTVVTIFCISFYFYQSDRHERTYRGKSGTIPCLSGSKWMIHFITYSSLVLAVIRILGFNQLTVAKFEVLGLLVGSLGLILFILSKMRLGENYSPLSKAVLPNELITDGLYRYVRNPIYTSNLFILLSLFFISGCPGIACNFLLLLIVYISAIKHEEAALELKFGNVYRRYKNKTTRLLPFIF